MYQTISDLLQHHDHVVLKDKDNDYFIFSKYRDEDGDFRNSSWYKTLQQAKQHIGAFTGYIKEDIERFSKVNNWQIIDAYSEHNEPFKIGQKVRVRQEAKEMLDKWGGRNNFIGEYLGQVGKVTGFGIGYYQIKFNDNTIWDFSHDCLSAWLGVEEQLQDNEIIITEDMVGKKIKIIK